MKRSKPFVKQASAIGQLRAPAAASTLAIVLSACSADVGRFDFPSFNLNGQTETSALPTPSEPIGGSGSLAGNDRSAPDNSGYYPDRVASRSRDVDSSPLSEPPSSAPAYPAAPSYNSPARTYEPPRATYQPPGRYEEPRRTTAHNDFGSSAAAAPDSIEVVRGDTLYSLARRHGLRVEELMAANGLTNSAIKPGQRLRLPNGSTPAISSVARRSPPAAAPRVAAAEPDTRGDWGGTYFVRPGDSLYRIARMHRVRVAELQRANGITDPRQLRPGTTLRVPGSGAPSAPAVAQQQYDRGPQPAAVPRYIPSTANTTVINGNGPREVAALDQGRLTDAAPPSVPPQAAAPADARSIRTVAVTPPKLDTSKLRWPARGKVIAGFGPRTDGTHNDGINVAVPQGADVHAAEDGEVAYAGSELKGYGNLILIRHDNGWVTAYAHNDSMSVKRGDKVRRGDIIAKAGRTGQVDQPQIHFELRQGAKPVDPLPYLERL